MPWLLCHPILHLQESFSVKLKARGRSTGSDWKLLEDLEEKIWLPSEIATTKLMPHALVQLTLHNLHHRAYTVLGGMDEAFERKRLT